MVARDEGRTCEGTDMGKAIVSLRRFPYPYKAALAICSDIDETRTTAEFLEIQRFLNTKDVTSMGEGVGLEIGNSVYFYDDERHFSYFTHDERARAVIRGLIRAGYVDCLHSYGDAVADRGEIQRALDVLYVADCTLDVWVNHQGASNNLCGKFEYMFGGCEGDDPRSNVYHADATIDYGIRFVWVGAISRVVGQSAASNTLSSLSAAFDPQYPWHSSLSVLRESAKIVLGQFGDERYILRRQNQLSRVIELRDGRRVHEFMRYADHPVIGGLGATSRGLAYVLSKRALEHLKVVEGFAIIYTHLGKNRDCRQVVALETQAALRNLEREYRDGRIYVTTTSKLLNYHRAWRYLSWSHREREGCTQILVDCIDDPAFGRIIPTVANLQGVTFEVPDRNKAEIYIRGIEVKGIQGNPPDDSGAESVMVPVAHLSPPPLGEMLRQARRSS